MTPFRVLVTALYVQVVLGLARFVLPYFGVWLDDRVWLVHPFNGIAIAIAALVLFRPAPGAPATRARAAARFAPLLPLLLGLGMGVDQERIGSFWAVVIHMVAGIAAVRVMGTAMAEPNETTGRHSAGSGFGREGRA